MEPNWKKIRLAGEYEYLGRSMRALYYARSISGEFISHEPEDALEKATYETAATHNDLVWGEYVARLVSNGILETPENLDPRDLELDVDESGEKLVRLAGLCPGISPLRIKHGRHSACRNASQISP